MCSPETTHLKTTTKYLNRDVANKKENTVIIHILIIRGHKQA